MPTPAFAICCRKAVFTPAKPMMKVRIPLVYAVVVELTERPLSLPLPQLFGSPSVASIRSGGEPAGGGFAAKSATAVSIAAEVGVDPPAGGLLGVSVARAVALLSARGAEKPVTYSEPGGPSVQGNWSPANSSSPKYTFACAYATAQVPAVNNTSRRTWKRVWLW